jgi:hypothetical protein
MSDTFRSDILGLWRNFLGRPSVKATLLFAFEVGNLFCRISLQRDRFIGDGKGEQAAQRLQAIVCGIDSIGLAVPQHLDFVGWGEGDQTRRVSLTPIVSRTEVA